MVTEPAAEILRDILNTRKQKNISYSISALARDVGVSQSLLSLILHGKRKLTTTQAQKISILLNLKKNEEKKLIESTLLQTSKNQKFTKKFEQDKKASESNKLNPVEVEKFTTISQWHHLPILTLVTTRGFRNDLDWIAKRLGITAIEAKDAIERLKKLNLLVEKNGKLKETNARIEFAPRKSEIAVREHHHQMMNRARDVMFDQTDEKSWKLRDISSMSIGVDPAKIDEAKELIAKCKEDLLALMTKDASEVYQFNIQFFPLSRSPK